MSSTMMIDILAQKCNRPGSFNAFHLVQHLQQIGPSAHNCFQKAHSEVLKQWNEHEDNVDKFCRQVWQLSNNNHPIICVTKAALVMRNAFLLETIRETLQSLRNNRDGAVEAFTERLEAEIGCNLENLLHNAQKLELFGVPPVANYSNSTSGTDYESELKMLLLQTVRKAPRSRFCIVDGVGGIGKTSLVSNLFSDVANTDFLMNDCNVQTIIWLNCFRWRSNFDRQAFEESLIELEQKHSKIIKTWKGLRQMCDFYKDSLGRRIMLILDDCSNPAILTAMRSISMETPCCVITRRMEDLGLQRMIAGHRTLTGLSDETILEIMAANNEAMALLLNEAFIRLCHGSPFAVSLWALRLSAAGDYNLARTIIPRSFGQVPPGQVVAVEDLAEMCLAQISHSYGIRLSTFLLFDPLEPIAADLLVRFWRMPKLDFEIMIEHFQNSKLIISCPSGAYCMHTVLFEALLCLTKRRFAMAETVSLSAVRIRLISQSTCQHVNSQLALNQRYSEASAFVHALNQLIGNGLDALVVQTLRKAISGDFRFFADVRVQPQVQQIYETEEQMNFLHFAVEAVDDRALAALIVQSVGERIAKRKTLSRQTPLAIAASHGHLSVVEHLFDIWPGALAVRDQNGRTPLALAAWMGHLNVVRYLYQLWPNVVAIRDRNDRTPLALAAWNGHLEVVEFLFQVWPFALVMEDKAGRTPIALAEWNGHRHIVQYLNELESL